MSDKWIFTQKAFMFGTVLALNVVRAEVQVAELDSIDLSGSAPHELLQQQPLKDFCDLAAQVRESERVGLREEVAMNAPQEPSDETRQPPGGDGAALGELGEKLDQLQHALADLLEAKDRQRGTLEAGHARQQAEQAEQMAMSRSHLETRYADSPAEQEQHLRSFDQAAEAADKVLADCHAEQLQQFEERWQENLEQTEQQPLISPTDPDRDHR